jgi:hypothetical protein
MWIQNLWGTRGAERRGLAGATRPWQDSPLRDTPPRGKDSVRQG